jgi:hypothetical protein
MIWANERGEIIWQSKSEEQLFEDKTLATLFPAWSQGMTQSLLMKTDSSFVAIIPLGDGNGYFVLESQDRLLEMAYLTILQASLSMAVLVSLLLLSLLFYLLYKDYVYEQSLMHLAFEDELTGLPNKNHFVQEAAQRLGGHVMPYAVIILDIGKFNTDQRPFRIRLRGFHVAAFFQSPAPLYHQGRCLCSTERRQVHSFVQLPGEGDLGTENQRDNRRTQALFISRLFALPTGYFNRDFPD